MSSKKGYIDERSTHPGPPSSSTDGFFQTAPKLRNSFDEDEAFKRVFACYLPQSVQTSISPDVSRFGSLVQDPSILTWTADAERNPPYLRAFDTWGRRSNTLVTSEGWRNLQDLGIREGIVAIAYENQYGAYSRLYQFFKYHVWTPASALVTCPSGMHDGATRLLATQLGNPDVQMNNQERAIFERAYRHLTSRDPKDAWTSGQWMTERQGGSDVRNTETQATYRPEISEGMSTRDIDGLPLGPWVINGFKWFSSATDSHMTIALAKTPSGALSTFFIPMRRQISSSGPDDVRTELNGITIQRLKSKMGTRALPTAELVLDGTRGYLLGQPGRGTKTISTILNITRLHTAMSAVAYWGGGLAIARAFTRVRKVGGKLLTDVPAHMHTLATVHVEYRGMMHLCFFVAALLGISESTTTTYTTHHAPYKTQDSHTSAAAAAYLSMDAEMAPILLRLLTPVSKAVVSRAAIAGLQECMEALGGVGYLENEDVEFNIARLFRDVNVLSIWEGTLNVVADDVLRVLKSPRDGNATLSALDRWIDRMLADWGHEDEWVAYRATVKVVWEEFRHVLESKSVDQLKIVGREVMWEMSWMVIGILLGQDARKYSSPVADEVCKRWLQKKATRGNASSMGKEETDWKRVAYWDRRIIFGDAEGLVEEKARL